tara:strand:- start:381 stop:1262 length:882 start_codon:yes stop_codon:yes gene_type:complete
MSLTDLVLANRQATELAKQNQINQANIDYNANIAAMTAPIPRMITSAGKIDKGSVGNIQPPMSFQDYYSTAQARMPKGVPIDMGKIQQDYQAISEMQDIKLGENLAQAKQAGLSDRRIVKDLQSSNPSLLKYYQETNQLPVKVSSKSPGRELVESLAGGTALYGGIRAGQMAVSPPTIPTGENLERLKSLGYDVKDGRIIKRRATKGMKKADIKAMREARQALNPAQKKLLAEASKKGAPKITSNLALRALQRGLLGRLSSGAAGIALGPVGAIGATIAGPALFDYIRKSFQD